jgi:hypothetical protein
MLEHGESDAGEFLSQLDRAYVVSRCPCGCASIDFEVEGQAPPTGGLRKLGDYLFGPDDQLAGVFIFECGGTLAGIEVWSASDHDAPRVLPTADMLWPMDNLSGGAGR